MTVHLYDDASTSVKGLPNKSEPCSVLNKSDQRRHRSSLMFLHFAREMICVLVNGQSLSSTI